MSDAVETLARVKRAAGQVAQIAREKAFSAGTTYTYVEDGKILKANQDGSVVEVRRTSAGNVTVTQRRWTLAQ